MEEILNFIISHNAAFIKKHDFGILSCNQYSQLKNLKIVIK